MYLQAELWSAAVAEPNRKIWQKSLCCVVDKFFYKTYWFWYSTSHSILCLTNTDPRSLGNVSDSKSAIQRAFYRHLSRHNQRTLSSCVCAVNEIHRSCVCIAPSVTTTAYSRVAVFVTLQPGRRHRGGNGLPSFSDKGGHRWLWSPKWR